jgi:hypothetical protein
VPLVPTDLPERLRDAGLVVHVIDGWEHAGDSADHHALIFHWTASSPSESPSSCANYSFTNKHYNVLVDRVGEVWLGMRGKANSSGEISGVALNEAFAGNVDWRSAASRGLADTTSANSELWSISMQNSGVGEPMSEALLDSMATTAAVCLDALGLDRSSFVSHHSAATARKIDLTTGTGGCPDGGEWNERITAALGGGGAGTGGEELTEAEWQRLRSEVQGVVVDVLRKEGVSGAATYAKQMDAAEKSEFQSLMTEVLRKEGVSGAANG